MRRTLCSMLLLHASVTAQMPWPVPSHFVSNGNTLDVDKSSLRIISSSSSSTFEDVAKRYTDIISKSTPAPSPTPQCDWESANVPCQNDDDCSKWVQSNCHPASTVSSYCKVNSFCHFSEARRGDTASAQTSVSTVTVSIASSDENLSRHTNESYVLNVSGTDVFISCENVFGAMRALETFSQLVSLNLLTDSLEIVDEPLYTHRGLMVDPARRFMPVSLLKSIIDGLR